MKWTLPALKAMTLATALATLLLAVVRSSPLTPSSPLVVIMADGGNRESGTQCAATAPTPPVMTTPPGTAVVEQKSQGPRTGATLVASFDGLGAGFEGPQGSASLRNPSDNSLAVGPHHIFQIVNTRMAIFTKRGRQFATTGKALYGPVPTNTIFKASAAPAKRPITAMRSCVMTSLRIAGWS